MKFEVDILKPEREKQYNDFLLSEEKNLLFASVNYKYLLERSINCKSNYFLVLKNNVIVGAFPLMIFYNSELGNIANSLPYYGSNGGLLVSSKLNEEEKNNIRNILLEEGLNYIFREKCVASTFITNPFDKDNSIWFENNFDYDYLDYRIGQITKLPDNDDDLDEILLKSFDNPRPRNIRKAIKSGIKVYASTNVEDFIFLFETHKENIESIGGLSKKKDFFLSLAEVMDQDDYNLYIAEKDGKKVAALLLFYFNKTVEYFTPATVVDYRNYQPSSLIIFNAMKDAVRKGFKYWNWGGTGISQEGIYNFKKKWGAVDYYYYYYTKIFDKNILNLSKEKLLNSYSNFFVLPFKYLNNN